MKSLTVDMTDGASIKALAKRLTEEFPNLNVLINNAGIMRPENVLDHSTDLTDAEALITTNLLGPIRLTSALLPLLRKQLQAAVMNVSSGLAFVPLAMTPTYCATKAALHSYTESLRYQLKDTTVEVLELIPPHVQTTLMGDGQAADSDAMPLAEFITEVMDILKTQPHATEIAVERVRPLRSAADGGRQKYDQFFTQFNDTMTAALTNG